MHATVSRLRFQVSFIVCLFGTLGGSAAFGQGELAKSLAIKPNQSGIDYDTPKGDRLKGCKVISSKKAFGLPGYIVHDASGQMLRLFLDRNKDRNLDRWSYYKDGIEVYRDSDNNFNGTLDEFRWLGTAGSRIGVDRNEDRTIDGWSNISVEEVAKEAFMAIKTRDQARFGRLLLTQTEFDSLGLSGKVGSAVAKRLEKAKRGFDAMVRGHSGNGQPGVAAVSKADGISKDITCYDHASTVFENSGKFGNLSLGTVVRVDNNWRLMELPELVDPKKPISNGGVLFPMQMIEAELPEGGQVNDGLVRLFEKLDKTDKAVEAIRAEGNPKKNAVRLSNLHKEKALAGIEIFKEVEPDQRLSWLQNVTDNVADAYRAEEFPTGLSFLNDFSNQLSRSKITKGLDYIRWRSIYAEYSLKLRIASAQGRKQATTKLMGELERFYGQFPSSEFAPEALHQLGQNYEVDQADREKAVKWYQVLASKFPKTAYGRRAQGALNRINGKGKRLPFEGKTSSGKSFNLASSALRGKIVVLHFWDSESTTGFKELQKLNAKWEDEVVVVGANIDETTEKFSNFMKDNRAINWTQLHAPGGMDKSPLATQVGLVAQPLAMIFDLEGNLVEDNIAFGDLEREVQRILRAKK
jgi:hypothetical protein